MSDTHRRKLNVMLMTDVIGRGGAEKALVDLALRIDRSRYNVSVCATRSAGNYQPILDAAGVRTTVIGRKSRWELYRLLGLVSLMRKQPVHILHTHLFGSNTWGRLLGKLAGVPVIVAHEHWSTKSRPEVWVDTVLSRLSDRVIVPSVWSKETVVRIDRIPSRLVSVIYNGVDISQFAPNMEARNDLRLELGFPQGAFVVGTVGRLSPEKGGVDNLIRAVARLREERHEARLLIVGDGPLRVELESLNTSLGSPAIFAGLRSDVARVLNALDVFVMPSLNEALPIALLEAMSVKLPVVATRVGGIPEVLEDGKNGLLVPPGDVGALEAALRRLASDPEQRERLGSAGQAQVHSRFTLDEMARQVEEVYSDIARRKLRRHRQ